MNFTEQQPLTYVTAHGARWRLDCLGDMRTSSTNPYFPAEMLEIYPQQVVRAGIQDVWQHKPVSLEVCFTVAGWKERGYDRRLHSRSGTALACDLREHKVVTDSV